MKITKVQLNKNMSENMIVFDAKSGYVYMIAEKDFELRRTMNEAKYPNFKEFGHEDTRENDDAATAYYNSLIAKYPEAETEYIC